MMVAMGSRGRSQKFRLHWHEREIVLPGGDRLTWALIDDPRHGAPHVEFGKITSLDGNTPILRPTETHRLLVEHDHSDAGSVPVEANIGRDFSH
jgi:hypothetical protein